MLHIAAPLECVTDGLTVFLAGGISDTADWQAQMVARLAELRFTLFNPRRAEFPEGDERESERQIEWEWRHLQRADLVAFWFPPETMCPVALFELGACSAADVPLVVGTHPDYCRRFDVVQQLKLRRPEVEVHCSLDAVVDDIKNFVTWATSQR